MDSQDPKDKKDDKPHRKHLPKITKKKLDRFLASICEAGGMTGKTPKAKKSRSEMKKRLICRGPCEKAEWRAHLDIPSGILCVSAIWSTNKHAHRHRDITVSITYMDEKGRTNYTDMVFCDSEVRWIMETLWHAPIWE